MYAGEFLGATLLHIMLQTAIYTLSHELIIYILNWTASLVQKWLQKGFYQTMVHV